MSKSKSTPIIREKWCKSCGLCVAFCPQKVFESDQFGKPIIKSPENCIGCLICSMLCPDMAIDIVDADV